MIVVEPGQTLLDVALNHFGNAAAVLELAKINGLSATDEVAPGTKLIVPNFKEPVYTGSLFTAPLAVKTEAIVKQGQTLFDVAIQHCGDAIAVLELARINGYTPEADVKPGTWLKLPAVIEPSIVSFFLENYYPATGKLIKNTQPEERPKGIGYWIIEKDFIVS